jgi:hypothetical protein
MAPKFEKVRQITSIIPKDLYDALRYKALEEGMTIQKAIFYLIINYVSGKFDIKNKI